MAANKLGFLVSNLGPSQLSVLLINGVNNIVGSSRNWDFTVFCERLIRPCISPNFGIMQLYEGWGYDGALVATNFRAAEKLISFPSAKQKLFYIWELEWLRMRPRSYRHLHQVYCNPQLQLITRNSDYSNAIDECWNRSSVVVGDFDFDKILGLVT